MIILNEENRELRGKLFPIPDGVRKHLKKTLSDYDEKDGNKNNDGYDRLVYLCDQERITMEELKRIKNFFDNYHGTHKSDDYILNGGKEMSDWVNRILKVATDTNKNEKEAKRLMGLDNKKKGNGGNKPEVAKPKLDKIQTKNLSNSISKNNSIKEQRIVIINERQLSLIKEAMSPSFSFDTLEKLCMGDYQALNGSGMQSFASYEYCCKEIGPALGSGSERIVFDLDDETVLKLEKPMMEGFTTQNETEYNNWMTLTKSGVTIIPKILNHSPYFFWLTCERAVPARTNDFVHVLGIPFYIRKEDNNIDDEQTAFFGNHEEYPVKYNPHSLINKRISVMGFMDYIEYGDEYADKKEQIAYQDLMNNNPWFNQFAKLIDIMGSTDLHVQNFGMVQREGEQPTMVVLDLGL